MVVRPSPHFSHSFCQIAVLSSPELSPAAQPLRQCGLKAKPLGGFADSPESNGGLEGGMSDRTECGFAVEQSVKFPG
jgi:hypothetical protein